MPKSLFGRAALILLVPVIAVQLLVSVAFIQRHYENVTVQLTTAVTRDVKVLLPLLGSNGQNSEMAAMAQDLAKSLGITYSEIAVQDLPAADLLPFVDLAGDAIVRTLRRNLDGVLAVDLRSNPALVQFFVAQGDAALKFDIPRGRFSASNPHQLLVLMVFAGIIMTLISFMFMRNQLTPITRMAAAAAAFGRGQHVPYAPRGSTEVRAAGLAFLAMRARIERQIESRTLMLSGVSHDLRSPLTRLKLGIALLPEDDDTRALLADIADMERLLEEFLAFARGDAMEESVPADPADVLRNVVAKVTRGATADAPPTSLHHVDACPPVIMRPEAVARALENLIGNAQRFGTRIDVSMILRGTEIVYVIEDDGPGIPEDKRLQATEPFARLDAARNPNQGGGVGLGLAIASDVARSHGGELTLGDSARLGGLRAQLRLARG
ncbi:MAG: ATP-binding protein [Cypionkella sp.]|nr:ATP-binding protein [Cypionkella sp.]